MKKLLSYKKTIIGGALAAAVAGGLYVANFVPDLIVSDANITIAQSGIPLNYFDVTCSGVVKSIIITGSYVRLHDCELTGSASHSIRVGDQYRNPSAPLAHHVIIENNHVHNSVTENGVYPNCGRMSGGWGTGIKLERGSADVTVRNNTVNDTCGEGIAATMSADALFEDNISFNNFAGNIYTDISPRTIIRNNTVSCSAYFIGGRQSFGISSGAEFYEGWGGNRDGLVIVGNTVDGCYDGISVFKGEPGADNALRTALIDNNTVVHGSRWSIVIGSGILNTDVTVSNNHVFRPVYVASLAGVVLSNNVIYNGTPVTPVPVTSTRTSAPATATWTATVLPSTLTSTLAAVTSTKTATPVFVTPTFECYLFPAHGQRVCLP